MWMGEDTFPRYLPQPLSVPALSSGRILGPGQTPRTEGQQLWKENGGTLPETPQTITSTRSCSTHPSTSNPHHHALTLNFSFTSRSSESSSNSF